MNDPRLQLDWIAGYDALTKHAGLVDLGERTWIEVSGADRASFLHNLCTNEVRKLSKGAGCEAFLTSVQGKALGHVFLFVTPESLFVESVSGQAEAILKHLDHYLVCERVTLSDRSQQSTELLLAGPESEPLLQRLTEVALPETRLSHVVTTLAGRKVWIARNDLAGPVGFVIRVAQECLTAVRTALIKAGAVDCSLPAFEAARIEWGSPFFGIDISDKNLPQEVGRDQLAISFVKGCYLGQETVARIDALGHVNKTLVGVQFHGADVPRPGLDLLTAGQLLGQVTSTTFSPRLNAPLALAYVRRGSNVTGTCLNSMAGECEVVNLPVA